MVDAVNNIILKKVSFSYEEEKSVLKNIDISIEKGKYLAILGSSGSGKSTLLRLVAGVLPKKVHSFKGEIDLFGKSPQEYLETGKLTFMFQDAILFPNINVRKNIEFPLVLRGDSVDRKFVDDLLAIIGLEEHQDKYPSELSGGMKTRVALARSFITKPELLLLDEPFSALDISWKYELYSYLEKIKEHINTTVIIVTHDINEAVLLADKIVTISSNGSIMTQREILHKSNRYFDYEYTNQFLENNQETILGLQTDIVIDGVRNVNDANQAQSIAKYLLKRVREGTEDDSFVFDKLNSLQRFCSHPLIAKLIIQLWDSSTSWKFKQELIWRLTDIPDLSLNYHQEVYDFIYNDFGRFEKHNKKRQYFRISEVVNITRDRINSTDFPKSKDWLYLVYLYTMSKETKMVTQATNFIFNYISANEDVEFLVYIKSIVDYEKVVG